MISDNPVFFKFGSTITQICVYIWLHAFQYLYVLYYSCCYNVYVFKSHWISRTSRSGSNLSNEPSRWLEGRCITLFVGKNRYLWRLSVPKSMVWQRNGITQWHPQSFINSLETQTQQQPTFQVDPEGAEQRVQHESHHVSIDTTSQSIVIEMTLNLDAIPVMMIQIVWCMHLLTFKI